jgi:hypothetical protein
LNGRNDEDDPERSHTVVCRAVSEGNTIHITKGVYLLMLLPVAGKSGGKRKRTVVRMI